MPSLLPVALLDMLSTFDAKHLPTPFGRSYIRIAGHPASSGDQKGLAPVGLGRLQFRLGAHIPLPALAELAVQAFCFGS
jgi:hypothetical protein